MSQSQDEVMEVLARSQDSPSYPFTGTLEYTGISVSLRAVREYKGSQISTLNPEIIDTAPEYIKQDYDRIIQDDLVYTEKLANSLLEVCSLFDQLDSSEYEYVLLEYHKRLLVVQPEYRLIFTIYPNESNQEFYGIIDSIPNTIPDSPPKIHSVKGEFEKDGSTIKFTESSWISRLLNRSEIELMNLTISSPHNVYDIPTLQSEPVLVSQSENTAEYCSVDMFISNNDCVLKCDHSEGPVTFRIPLTDFNALPEWSDERLDTSDILLKMDEEQNLLAKIQDATESTPSEWVSEFGDKELITLE